LLVLVLLFVTINNYCVYSLYCLAKSQPFACLSLIDGILSNVVLSYLDNHTTIKLQNSSSPHRLHSHFTVLSWLVLIVEAQDKLHRYMTLPYAERSN